MSEQINPVIILAEGRLKYYKPNPFDKWRPLESVVPVFIVSWEENSRHTYQDIDGRYVPVAKATVVLRENAHFNGEKQATPAGAIKNVVASDREVYLVVDLDRINVNNSNTYT